jgi:glycopeptide antibiotics resistance protein
MNLKNATMFALIGTWLHLIVSMSQWTMSSFDIVSYEHIWVYRGFWLVLNLLATVPLIIFLTVLQKKQKGDSNA